MDEIEVEIPDNVKIGDRIHLKSSGITGTIRGFGVYTGYGEQIPLYIVVVDKPLPTTNGDGWMTIAMTANISSNVEILGKAETEE